MGKAFTIYQNESLNIKIRDASLPETADKVRDYANEGYAITVLNADTEAEALDIAIRNGFAETLDELLQIHINREYFMRDMHGADWRDTDEIVENLKEKRKALKGFLKKPEIAN